MKYRAVWSTVIGWILKRFATVVELLKEHYYGDNFMRCI